MLIRGAQDKDWAQIWPFRRQIVGSRETYARDPSTSEAQARTLWRGPGKRAFVAEVDGAVVGSAHVAPNCGGPAAGVADADFMVDPARGRRGIGRALAEHVLERAKAGGYRGMVFNAVVETNPAVGVWTSLGFTILGTVPDAYEHARYGRVALHIMYRAL
ncbi:GNAT family N-acetyltransferase [Streptomyces sp. NPDC057636]|uniref:GNAT family N-acetyltransferase n=1 Tax=Streptomyces sp. NPDC057636 TaxID=3346189 RepID=UPI0036A0273A